MHNCIAIILLLALPATGQMLRGNAGTRFSGLHNHFSVPIDGGQVWAWDMQNPAGGSTCTGAGFAGLPNNASFTGSLGGTGAGTGSMHCGGSGTAATLTSTGLNFVATTDIAVVNTQPSMPNGWTQANVFNPSSLGATNYCGLLNINSGSFATGQYGEATGTGGALGFLYINTSTNNEFATASGFILTSTWNVAIGRYTSANASSAKIWVQNKLIANTWISGTGTQAIPAVAGETDEGNFHQASNSNACLGTIGAQLLYDHAINDSAEGFIYRAFNRTMKFRGASVP